MDVLIFKSPDENQVSDRMFGVKLERSSGPEDSRKYAIPMDYVSSTSVRFTYDVDLGPLSKEGLNISTAEAIGFAASEGRPVVLCIVTKNLFLADTDDNIFTPREIDHEKVEAIGAFVRDLLASTGPQDSILPNAIIDAIELGNEYWGIGEMTSAEYGKLVNVLARSIQESINDLGLAASSDPNILVQMGSHYAIEFDDDQLLSPYANLSFSQSVRQANLDIMSQITDPFAKDAIDALVEHYYYTGSSDAFEFTPTSLRSINTDWALWENNGFGDKDLYITEWNNKLNNPSQFGLKGAGVMIEMFENMMRMGVDSANVWPFQHNHTRLVDTLTLDADGLPRLTPRGAAFKLMAEALPGTRRIDSNLTTQNGYDYELNGYVSDDKYVFFVSSRLADAQSISLDLSDVVSGYSRFEGVQVGFDAATADGVFREGNVDIQVPMYQDPDALATLTTFDYSGSTGSVTLNLDAFEFVRLIFTLVRGFDLVGGNRVDTLVGGDGNDSISGNGGSDVLQSYAGFDLLKGGSGKDQIFSGMGNDQAYGGSGSDTIYGEAGADTIDGGGGNDLIYGGLDNDFLNGGAGSDTLFGGAGNDRLTGGNGSDFFVFNTVPGLSGIDRISDFVAADDTIFLGSAVFGGLLTGGFDTSSFAANSTGTATDSLDRIIYERDSGKLFFDMDGKGGAAGIHFVTLAPGLGISASDFFVN